MELAGLAARLAEAKVSIMFSAPEKELLRLALTIAPDWPVMRGLIQGRFDWEALRHTALSHQSDGVIAWRLTAPELAGMVPEAVRQDCARYLDSLDTHGRDEWWQQRVRPAVEALEAAGVTWVTNSGPVQYLPLGMSFWPRIWDDFDVFVPAEDHHQTCRALESAGLVFNGLVCETLNPLYSWADGSKGVEIIGLPPEHEELPIWAWHHRPEFYEGRVLREVHGLPVWTPAPEWMVALMAYRTYVAYCRQATPLPLWGLARLWAWRQWIGDDWNEAEFVRSIRLAAEVGWPATRHLPNVTWARGILFTLEIASRVYGPLVPKDLTSLLEGPFYFLVSEPGPGHRGVTEEIMEIARWPSDEEVIFDLGYSRSSQEKIQRAHWRRIEESHAPRGYEVPPAKAGPGAA